MSNSNSSRPASDSRQGITSSQQPEFVGASEQTPTQAQADINSHWPESQLLPTAGAMPLNYHAPTTLVASIPAGMVTAASENTFIQAQQTRTPTPNTPAQQPNAMNQNQAHAQSHPWRIKVYNACLACRKKKIKCDGQPTCSRCARLGFECSYIEVPGTPQQKSTSKASKSKSTAADATSTSTTVAAMAAANSTPQVQAPQSKSHHQHQQQHYSISNNTIAKEIRQQCRSSTKDVASGSFPHSSNRRNKEPSPLHSDSNLDRAQVAPPTLSLSMSKKDLCASEPRNQLPGLQLTSAFMMERDTTMPDLYHILVNSVTIPNVSKQTHSASMGVDQLQLTFTSPIPTFTVFNAEQTDPDQHHSTFQKDPSTGSFQDQATPLGFVITNKSVIQYLVHVYFECFHNQWMIVDKNRFLAQLKDANSPPDPLLLVAICAAGAKYSDHVGLCAEPGNLATIGEQFLTHARILLQDRFDTPSMSTLQSLLILYWCQVQTGRASLRFMYVGMAIRMAQEMGLNRPLDPKKLKEMDEREVQIRKTIWWSCYQADRWTSAALGKPMVISDVDCLVDYPSNLNDEDAAAVRSFRHMTDLAKILGKVTLHLYTSTNAATCSSAVFSHLDQSLSNWIQSLQTTFNQESNTIATPQSMDSSSATSKNASTLRQKERTTATNLDSSLKEAIEKSENGAIGYYALLFHTVRIMLYRPFLHNNNALAPVLPLTLQSPQSRCGESATAISEIAEMMVKDQRAYRQLFNTIHISLCAAATVHRFMIASPKTEDHPKGQELTDGRPTAPQESTATITQTVTPRTPSGIPLKKNDHYHLTLILRILHHCCRFSIEKNLLLSILESYLPQKHLTPQELAWSREEIHRPFLIVPFSIKMPFQISGLVQNSIASRRISSTSGTDDTNTSAQLSTPMGQPALTQAMPMTPMQVQQQDFQQQPSFESSEQSQLQQYQQRLRHHQTEQHLARRQSLSRPLGESTSPVLSAPSSYDQSPFTVGPHEEFTFRQSSSRSSSVGGYTNLVSTTPGGFGPPALAEQPPLNYELELNILRQHHQLQQSELDQHHQQQTLQLEQAQLYQQQQQRQQQQSAKDSASQQRTHSIFNPQGPSQQQGSLDNRRVSSGGMTHPRVSSHSSVSERNRRHSHQIVSKKKQESQTKQQKQQQQQQRDQFQRGQQQQSQSSRYQDRFTMDVPPPDVNSNMALTSLAALIGSDEMMTNTSSAPSVISQLTGTTDLASTNGIASLDELLGLEPEGYYPDMPMTMEPNSLSLSNQTSIAEDSDPTGLVGPSNRDQLWYSNSGHSRNNQQDSGTVASATSNNSHNYSQISGSDNSGGSCKNKKLSNNNNGNNNSSSSGDHCSYRKHRNSQKNINSNSNNNSESNNSNNNNSSFNRGSTDATTTTTNNHSNSNSHRGSTGSNAGDGNSNYQQGRFDVRSGSMVGGGNGGGGNIGPTWLGLNHLNSGGTVSIPPVQSIRQGDNPVGGYPYPDAFSYPPQQPLPQHMAQLYVGYPALGRSTSSVQDLVPMFEGADHNSNSNTGVHPGKNGAPNQAPPSLQQAYDGSGLSWQQQQPLPQFEQFQQQQHPHMVSLQTISQTQMIGPSMYSSKDNDAGGGVYASMALQQPQRQSAGYYYESPVHPHQQPMADLPPMASTLQQQQSTLQPPLRPSFAKPTDLQCQQPQMSSTTMLPPLPQNVYRTGNEEIRASSPGSSNTSALTNSNSGQSLSQSAGGSQKNNTDSGRSSHRSGRSDRETTCSSDHSGRETSSGTDNDSNGSPSAQQLLEGNSNGRGSSFRTHSQSVESFSMSSNMDSSSNATSPNSNEEASNSNASNEFGSSSSDNAESRSPSTDRTNFTKAATAPSGIVPSGTGQGVMKAGGGGGAVVAVGASSAKNIRNSGGTGSSSKGNRRRRTKNSLSPTESINSLASSDANSSLTGAIPHHQQHQSPYHQHQLAQEITGSNVVRGSQGQNHGGGSRTSGSDSGSRTGQRSPRSGSSSGRSGSVRNGGRAAGNGDRSQSGNKLVVLVRAAVA